MAPQAERKKRKNVVFCEKTKPKIGRPAKDPNAITEDDWKWLFQRVTLWKEHHATSMSLGVFVNSVQWRLRMNPKELKRQILQIEKRMELKKKYPQQAAKSPQVTHSPYVITLGAIRKAELILKDTQERCKATDALKRECEPLKRDIEARDEDLRRQKVADDGSKQELEQARQKLSRQEESINRLHRELADHTAMLDENNRVRQQHMIEAEALRQCVAEAAMTEQELAAANEKIAKLDKANSALSKHIRPMIEKAAAMEKEAKLSQDRL